MKYWAAFAVMSVAVVFSIYLSQNKRLDLKSKSMYLQILLGLMLFILNYEMAPESFRIIFNIALCIFLSHICLPKKLKESCILGILVYFVTLVSEIFYVILSLPIVSQKIFMLENYWLVFVQNMFVGFIQVLISYYIGKKDWYAKLVDATNKIRSKQIVVFSLLLVVLFNFFIWITYFASKNLYNNGLFTLVGSSISIFSAIFLFIYLKTNSSYKEVSEKYDLSLKSIEEYERMIDNSKLNNHETRNQFMTIRNMSKNKKITNYIDTLLDNKINDNEQLLSEVSRLPKGGIRGLVYSKLLDMQEKKINYNLLIDKKISITKFSKIEDNLIVDICKILGVFLDNAIEAVELLKEKDIVIEIYADKKDIVFSITNNFEEKLELDELSTTKYSTKGKGRGYGLSLVKGIINKSNKLENSTEIYEDNFTQNLKIKM